MLGLAGAFAATRLISSLLYGVKPVDPVTFACVLKFLSGVAIGARFLAARKATKADPFSTTAPYDASATLKSLFGVTDINNIPNALGPAAASPECPPSRITCSASSVSAMLISWRPCPERRDSVQRLESDSGSLEFRELGSGNARNDAVLPMQVVIKVDLGWV